MQQRYRPTIERKRHSIHVRLTGPELDYLRQAAAVHRTTISAYLLGLVDADMADYWRDQIRRRREPMPEPPRSADAPHAPDSGAHGRIAVPHG